MGIVVYEDIGITSLLMHV